MCVCVCACVVGAVLVVVLAYVHRSGSCCSSKSCVRSWQLKLLLCNSLKVCSSLLFMTVFCVIVCVCVCACV